MPQTGELHQRELGEENQRHFHGLQVHGEHQRLPRDGQGPRSARPGELPDRRSLGEAESQLCRRVPPVARQKGEIRITLIYFFLVI